MNGRRIDAAAITAWFVSIPLGALIHHGVLGAVYAADAAAFRTVVAFAVVWNYVTQPISIPTGVFEVLEHLVAPMISGAVIGMVCQIRNTANDRREVQ